MQEELFTEIKKKFNNEIEKLSNRFNNLRTNVANRSIFEKIFIDYYGTKTPINQISSIAIVESRLFIITPYEKNKNILKDISTAILKSNINLTPIIKEDKIEINIPQITEEARKNIVKEAKISYENSKIAIRNIRHDFLNNLKKNDDYSDDFKKKIQNDLQKIVDDIQKKVDSLFFEKEKNIMKI